MSLSSKSKFPKNKSNTAFCRIESVPPALLLFGTASS